MNEEINLINNVIGTHFGNETEEEYKEYAQHVASAWNKILNHLAVEGYYDEEIEDEI
tara:strand:+ start:691 stop:861 length:171 start_codon:yes stop_codon:yes gene_type:complete